MGVNIAQAFKNPQAGLAQFVKGFAGLSAVDKAAVSVGTFLGEAEHLVPVLSRAGAGLAGMEAAGLGAASGIGSAGGAMGLLTNPIGLVVAALAAVTVGAIAATAAGFSLTKSFAETGSRLFDLSDKTGISIKNLNLFRQAAAETGKGLDVVERSFDQFTSRLEKASQQKPGTQLQQTFKSLGVDAKNGLQNVDKSLETAVKSLNSLENAAVRGAKAQEIFGLRNEAIVPILTRIGGSLEGYQSRLGNLGKITDEQARQAKSFELSLNLLKNTFGGIGASVGASLLPAFQSFIDLTQTVIKITGEGLLTVLGAAKGSIVNLAAGFDLMNAALRSSPAFVNVLKVALGEAIGLFLNFRSVIGQSASAAALFLSGNFAGAAALAGSAASGASNLTKGLGDKTRAALNDAKAQTAAEFLKLQEERKRLGVSGRLRTPSESSGSGASEAKAIRAAQEALDQARAKATFDIQEKLTKNIIELDKDAYDKRLISAEDYYGRVIDNELKLQGIGRNRIQSEIDISQNRQNQAKKGSPEFIREQAQQVELQKQLRILELERPNILRKISDELDKARKAEAERNIELARTSILSSPGFQALERFNADFDAKEKVALGKPQADLRKEELRLQGLANAGLIREEELTDALTLARRRSRDEIIKSLERSKQQAELEKTDSGRFARIAQIDEEIESIRNLGSELTRAERLQKRFAEQGVLDYGRVNDKLADLLADQKGLTEIFQDFRASTAQDLFNGIENGVDALTRRFGVLGSAVGTLLKDLAKLAATKLLEKILGIGSGNQQQPSFGFGQGGGRGSGFSLPNILGFGGGGNGPASFLTPGFNPSASTPVQQAISGGGSGGGSIGGAIQQAINPGGQQSGGGGLLGRLLGKIPGLKGIFSPSFAQAGAGAVSGLGPNIGNLPGVAQFGQLPLRGPGVGEFAASGLSKVGAAAPSALASLGATGLLAGGGILGGLAGGRSATGRALGTIGGTLGAGFLGSLGVFGSGIAGALPALLSNPFTAIIAGGLIGTALVLNFLKGKDQRKFRSETEKLYQLKVDGKQQGTALFESIKALGEEQYGKGRFGKHIIDTIKLEKAKVQLAAYGEATGQENNPLVRRYRGIRELTDAGDPRNQFIKRASGGLIPAPFFKTGFVPFPDLGRDTVATALRGEEFVTRPEVTRAQGVNRFNMLNAGRASIITNGELSQLHQAILAFESGRARLPFGQTSKFLSMLRAREASLSPSASFTNSTFIHRANGGYVPSAQSFTPNLNQMLHAQPSASSASTSAPSSSDPELKRLLLKVAEGQKMVTGSNVQLMQAISKLEGITEGQIVRKARQTDPDTFAGAVNDSMSRSSAEGQAIKNQVFKGR